MVAYQAESDLVRLVMPHYRRAEDEGRTLIQTALGAAGDIEVTERALHVHLEPLSSPHRTRALEAICEEIKHLKLPTELPPVRPARCDHALAGTHCAGAARPAMGRDCVDEDPGDLPVWHRDEHPGEHGTPLGRGPP